MHISWARLISFSHLGFISDPLIVSKFHNETHDPKGQENKFYTIVKGRETFYSRHTVPVLKPVLRCHSNIDKTKVLKTNGSLMRSKVLQNATHWSILQYLWSALSVYWSWKAILGRFECGRFRQVLLFTLRSQLDISQHRQNLSCSYIFDIITFKSNRL